METRRAKTSSVPTPLGIASGSGAGANGVAPAPALRSGLATAAVSSDVGPILGSALPADLVRLLQTGGLIILASRASSSGGSEARRLATQGIYTGAEELARRGLDLRPLLPDEGVLREAVRRFASKTSSKTRDGKRFTNHTYLHTDLVSNGVLLLIQYGTGTMIDESYVQPAIDEAAKTVRLYRPILVHVNEVRSWGRSAPGLAPLLWQLRETGDLLGEPIFFSDKKGIRRYTLQVERELTNAAYDAEQEAKDTEDRTSAAIAHRSTGGPVEGAFEILTSGAVPPPLATCHVRATEKRSAYHAGFLDTPGARPAESLVLYGLPQVFEQNTIARRPKHRKTGHRKASRQQKPQRRKRGHGKPVDQLALVRWFYEHYLVGEWTTQATAEYLAAHGFSTEGLRRRRGRANAICRVRRDKKHRATDARNVCDSIWEHRQFHLTGHLEVQLRGDRRVIFEVATPDGRPIANHDQIKRIERAKELLASTRPRARVCLLTGVRGTHNGVRCSLTPEHRGDRPLCWHFQTLIDRGRRRKGQRAPRPRRPPQVSIPHWALVGAVFRAATEADLLPVMPDEEGPQRSRLENDVELADREYAELERAAAAAWAHVANPGHDGDPKSLREARAVAHAADAKKAEAHTRATLATAALATFDERTHSEVLALEQFLEFAEAFRDPFDSCLRTQLLHSIVDLEATSTRNRRVSDLRHGQVDFSFKLRMVDSDGQLWVLPVHGRYDAGGALAIGPKVYAALVAMQAGTPAHEFFGKGYLQWLPYVRAALTGDPHAPCVIVNVREPWLLRLGMALLYSLLPEPEWDKEGLHPMVADEVPLLVGPPPTAGQRARRAREFEESPAFAHRIVEQYSRSDTVTGQWLPCSAPKLATAIEAAAAGELLARDLPKARSTRDATDIFEVDGRRARLTPCPTCGSRDRSLLQLREPVGLICNACRLDEAGNWWPERYDQFRMRTDRVGSRRHRLPCVG